MDDELLRPIPQNGDNVGPWLTPSPLVAWSIPDDIDDQASSHAYCGNGDQCVRMSSTTGTPVPLSGIRIVEPWMNDPFPDYDTGPVMPYANG